MSNVSFGTTFLATSSPFTLYGRLLTIRSATSFGSPNSSTISLDEAKHVYQEGAKRLIVGAGQHGTVTLSDEASGYFKRKGCLVELEPTPAATRSWNNAKGAVIGLFHVTC